MNTSLLKAKKSMECCKSAMLYTSICAYLMHSIQLSANVMFSKCVAIVRAH